MRAECFQTCGLSWCYDIGEYKCRQFYGAISRIGAIRQAGPTLLLLEGVHTVIWLVMTTANFAGFYLALVGRFNTWFFAAAALLGGEIVVIVANRWHCPLTDVMVKYTEDTRANFDFYRPEWLARHNIKIFGVLIAVEVAIVLLKNFVLTI